VTRPTRLSDIEIKRELSALPGWARKGETLTRTYTFATFPKAIAWVGHVAEYAERVNHHPDLDIRYNRVTAVLSTHEAGGVTSYDIAMAREMERIAAA
jgi:4a-hydroxytetrahydrobiopterin dehydratase